jgi:preprotein translocase SecE subunit
MHKDDAYWLMVGYVVLFALATYIGFKAIEMVGIQMVWTERYEWYKVAETFGGVVIGGALTWYVKRDQERNQYYEAAIAELRKVTWPTWPDVKRMTIIVCVVVGVFAVILGAFDFLWAEALKLLLT